MNSLQSKHRLNIRHGLQYKLFNKFQISRIFTFSDNYFLTKIIFANNLPCFYTMFPFAALITDRQHKRTFTPNSLTTSNKHVTCPPCENVTGCEETENTKGGTKTCCLHWFWFMKDFCQESFVLIFQTKGGSTLQSCNMKLMEKSIAPTPPNTLSYCLNYQTYPNWRIRIT